MKTVRSVISPSSIALMAIAVPFIAAGAIGLTSPELVPPLANPKIAWSLIGVGILMDAVASFQIVMTAKQMAAAQAQESSGS